MHEHVNKRNGKWSPLLADDVYEIIKANAATFDAEIVYDRDKPDGTPRKLMDTSRLTALGWRPSIGLREGLEQTYRWFLENREAIRA